MDSQQRSFTFTVVSSREEQILENALEQMLHSRLHLVHSVSYLLLEMVSNAFKANIKRAWFSLQGLDIQNPDIYRQGMVGFKKSLISSYEACTAYLEEHGMQVNVSITIHNNTLHLCTGNNAPLLPVEQERIRIKIEKSAPIHSIQDMTLRDLENQEGGGIGIILILMLLRNLGVEEDAFYVHGENGSTIACVDIPLTLVEVQESTMIADAIARELAEIPQFPEHILALQERLHSPDANFAALSDIVHRDPALTADILKIANSPLYHGSGKITSIEQAVKAIGFDGIKNHVLAYTTARIMQDKYGLEERRGIMEHSVLVAAIALGIVHKLGLNAVADKAYIAGILHDMGRMIVSAINPELMATIQSICTLKGINSDTLEDLSAGYNHGIIGAKLAEQWNFPESLVAAIRYHHIPLQAPAEDRALVSLIYMADRLAHLHNGRIGINQINTAVRRELGMQNTETFEAFVQDIFSRVKGFSAES